MYVGATGVVAHGDRMQVVGNNLANVSTVGYKKADAQFADLMSTQASTGSAYYQSGAVLGSQIGMGVGIGEIRNIFREGGLENTNTTTDLAITGQGFFGLRKADGANTSSAKATHFTRAGNFRFNKEAYLVDPHGYRLQGYSVDRKTGVVSSTLSDVQLPYKDVTVDGVTTRQIRSDPKTTTEIEMTLNLDALAPDVHKSDSNPFFSLLKSYESTQSNAATPFGASPPEFSSSLKVYDEEGTAHNLTVYFDPVSTDTLSNSAGYTYWEYLVALPGSSDGSAAYGTSSAGLAGLGVLAFDSFGQLVNHSAYSLNRSGSGDGKDLNSWAAASFASNGNVQFNVTFGNQGTPVGANTNISIDFGMSSEKGAWSGSTTSPATVGKDASALLQMDSINKDTRSSTSFDTGSSTLFQNQDGYTWGYLQNTSIDRDGFLTGHFSNGQNEQLYQISIYRFNSDWGLRRAGNNNFVATEASGAAIAGKAQKDGRGAMQQNTLEMSNVDMAEEFAHMILTQRGYQANTKVITTADSLLNTLISVKR